MVVLLISVLVVRTALPYTIFDYCRTKDEASATETYGMSIFT